MLKVLATFVAGYATYHMVNTDQGQKMAKEVIKSTLQSAGKAEDAITRALFKALETKPEEQISGQQEEHSQKALTITTETHDIPQVHNIGVQDDTGTHPMGTCASVTTHTEVCETQEETTQIPSFITEVKHHG